MTNSGVYYQSPKSSAINPLQNDNDYLETPEEKEEGPPGSTSLASSRDSDEEPHLERSLSFWDGMGVLVGIMIGSGIFASAGTALVNKYNAIYT